MQLLRLLIVAAAALGLLTSAAAAAPSTISRGAKDCVACLGAPVDIVSTASYFPLDAFKRITTTLPHRKKPELLFVGGRGGFFDAVGEERWPVVKALDQFGTLTGVSPAPQYCKRPSSGPDAGVLTCAVPTYDLSRARYTSKYLAFASRDLVNFDGKRTTAFQRLSKPEEVVFDRYARASGYRTYVDTVIGSKLPLVVIGDYAQAGKSQVLFLGDFQQELPPTHSNQTAGPLTGLPFADVHEALVRGKDSPPTSKLVENVNAEANIITALICHADGMKPASVCERSVIKSILKHVR